MYLGDILWTGGLALPAADAVSAALWIIASLATVRQALREDHALARQFPDAHARWCVRTGLLLPRLK
jgi:protein-S-isoprenylcysteine O-methyltransferase Ste14